MVSTLLPDSCSGQDERGAHLDDSQRAMLAPVAALVLPVVGGCVQADQIGRRRVIEDLSDVLVRVGIRLLGARWPRMRTLVRQRREAVGGGVGQRVASLDLDLVELPAIAVGVAAKPHSTVDGLCLVPIAIRGEHHVDDGFEHRIEQSLDHA